MKPDFDKMSATEREAIDKMSAEVEQYKIENPDYMSKMKTLDQFKAELSEWMKTALPEAKIEK